MNIVQGKQRNITPNFLRFKRKSNISGLTGKKSEQKCQQHYTDRSSSKASKCSFEVYERRILHMSRLKSHLQQKNKNEQDLQPTYMKKTNYVAGDLKNRGGNSNDKNYHYAQRENSTKTNHNPNLLINTLNDNKKKNSSSGKVLLKINNRTPSNPKRTQQSLEKEEARAKQVNTELLQNLMKNQIPNYIGKIKMKKMEANDRKKYPKTKMLDLTVPIQSQEQIKNYQIFGELGKGAYGIVRMGVDKRTGEKIAIKIYEKKRLDEPNKIKNLEREINILAELSHPTIAKLLQAIQTPSQIYLILEYGGANSLYNYLLSKPQHKLSQAQAKKFFHIIADTLDYLHRLQIVHRDIKAQNILINRHKQLKLIDFGFSLRCHKNETIDTFCGTPTYMAPQIVSKMDHCPIFTDMWSLGILFYVMLQGNYPFRARKQNQLFQKIRTGKFDYIHDQISQESKRMIQSLLKIAPLERLTINEVLSKENKEWLSTNFE